MPTKKCSKCGVEKDVAGFSRSSYTKSGYKSHCKECIHAYYIQNREMIISAVKKYDDEHKEQRIENVRRYWKLHRDERKQYAKDYRAKNYNERVRKDREYYSTHREHALETVKKYNTTPQGKLVVAKSRHNRLQRNKTSECSLTLEQWRTIIVLQRNTCAVCGIEFTNYCKPTKDHIIPLSKGGGLTFENVQALCKPCNCKKYNKLDYSKITTWIHVETLGTSSVNRMSEGVVI